MLERIQPVEVHVVNAGRVAIFMNQGKGRAGNVFLAGCSPTGGNTFHQSSFARSQVADQENNTGGGENLGQVVAKLAGFIAGARLKTQGGPR